MPLPRRFPATPRADERPPTAPGSGWMRLNRLLGLAAVVVSPGWVGVLAEDSPPMAPALTRPVDSAVVRPPARSPHYFSAASFQLQDAGRDSGDAPRRLDRAALDREPAPLDIGFRLQPRPAPAMKLLRL
ncbi:MAG TPA: hypothetical protein VFP98_00270, partial [Candidatus Polarisedimenticolia bacterium]|nr:hypothetical protein [Candidatus Polarisedimenticolia bacterium]